MLKRIRLKLLYKKGSKHSDYQILSSSLEDMVKFKVIPKKRRYEQERFKYIEDNLAIKDKKLLDIGGNTGYFSLESIGAGASKVSHYEGNKSHSSFLKISKEILGIRNLSTINKYYNFSEDKETYNIVLLLNVIHHIGDDYGSINTGKTQDILNDMISNINFFKNKTDYLVLQIGFNWKGDVSRPLFKKGTKKEMIDYVKKGTSAHWTVHKIGVAEKKGKSILYKDLDKNNIERYDELGEFLNRPIFILEAKR